MFIHLHLGTYCVLTPPCQQIQKSSMINNKRKQNKCLENFREKHEAKALVCDFVQRRKTKRTTVRVALYEIEI